MTCFVCEVGRVLVELLAGKVMDGSLNGSITFNPKSSVN